jgi:hypothetical protein
MTDNKIGEQIRILQNSRDQIERLRSISALGKMRDRLSVPNEPSETLSALGSYYDTVSALAMALRDPASPLIRAEAAWSLGQIGGTTSMRRLRYRLEEVFPEHGAESEVLGEEDQEQDDVIASLIAAAGQGLSKDVLAKLDKGDLDRWKQMQEAMLEKIKGETNPNLRVAMVKTVTAIAVRAREANVQLLTDLEDLLCSDDDSDAALAAIVLLEEAVPDAPKIASRWHHRYDARELDPEVENLLEEWNRQLGKCRQERDKLLEWLDAAAIIWELEEAARVD